MKKILFLFLFTTHFLYGQQVEQYSLAGLHDGVYNVAAYGSKGSIRMTGLVRQQWVKIAGSPTSQYLLIDAPFREQFGVGLSFQQSQLGAHKIQKINFGLNYRKSFEQNYISLGIAGGACRTEYDGRKLRTPEGEYGNGQINHQDDLLGVEELGGQSYQLDVGAYAKFGNAKLGISMLNAFVGNPDAGSIGLDRSPHLYGSMGYSLDVGSNVRVDSKIGLEYNSELFQAQFLLLGTWSEIYSIGFQARGIGPEAKESIGGIAGYHLNEHFQLFYSYEYNILPFRNVFDANHEVAVIYTLSKPLGKGQLPPVIYNPRYF